jgi:hypothetical protein
VVNPPERLLARLAGQCLPLVGLGGTLQRVGSAHAPPKTRKVWLMFNDNGSFLLALFELFLFFAWFMCLFWIFGDIFRSQDLGGGAKTLWVLFVIIIPWLGILVYLIARGSGMHQRQLEQAKDMQQAQAAYIQSVAGTSGNVADQIASAKALLDNGTITQAEFDQMKAKALAS